MYQRIILALIILFLLTVYALIPVVSLPAPLQWLDYAAYDARMQYAAPTADADKVDNRIIVVDIDEESQERFGRWPWPRDLTAELLDKISGQYQASTVGLDVYFPDKVFHGEQADQRLVKTLQQYSPVMAVHLNTKSDIARTDLEVGAVGKGPTITALNGRVPPEQLGKAFGFSSNLPKFVQPETITGHINPIDDSDGKNRRLSLLYQFKDWYLVTLSASLWRQSLAADGFVFDDHLTGWLDSPKWRLAYGQEASDYYVPVNTRGEVLVPYYTRPLTVSAWKILENVVDPQDTAGKFVLVGSSAQAQGDDLVVTPMMTGFPGVEIHAALLSAMLDQSNEGKQTFKVQPTHEPWLQVGLLCVVTLLLLGLRSISSSVFLIATLALAGLWVLLNYQLWTRWNVDIRLLPLLLLLGLLAICMIILDLVDITARHQYVHKMFGFYLPRLVVQRIANDRSGRDWLKPERKQMSVLFADMQGFTRMSEDLPPEAVAKVMVKLFTDLTTVIHAHKGTVDKYMGDAVMAFWGAPETDNDHALHAVQAAREMQKTVATLNAEYFSQQNIQIRLGIGINSGEMLVGNLGSEIRHAYTVMGSAVNLASAIQQLTREHQHDILLGEETAQQLPTGLASALGAVKSKKFSHNINVFFVNDSVN